MAFKTSSKQKLSTSSAKFSTSIGTAGVTGLTITSVYVTDSSYVNLDDTAVSTSGGYIKLIGTNFATGCTVYVNGVAASTTFISSTEVRAVISAAINGTYSLMLFNTDGSGAIWASGLTFSGFPSFTTASYSNNSNIVSVQLLASGDGTLVYSLQGGSTLPTGLTLSSTGLISGTATGITSATVANFTVLVDDAQKQTVQQAITLSITFGDDYFKYTTLAIQGDTTPWISDASSNALVLTPFGSAKTVPFTPFQGAGYYSNLFNGTNDYLSVPANAVFGFGTGDFTVEYWFYQTASTTSEYEIWESQTTNSFGIYKPIGMALSFRAYAGTDQTILAAASIPINTWTHVAVSRVSQATKAFVNGTQVLSIADSTNYVTPTAVYTIGGRNAGTNGFPGYISNLRVVKGTGLYTAAFTPATVPLTAVTNTTLLTCQNARFTDSSTTAAAITLGNTPKVTQNIPFTLPTNTYGSGYFNGTTDYISTTTSLNFGMGTGTYTIEAWIYPIASANSVLETTGGIQVGYQTTTAFGIAQRGIAWRVTGSAPTLNAWNHVAVVRSGTGTNQTAVYVNGVATLGTDATDYASTTGTVTIGGTNPSGGNYFSGYISNVRVLKGITVYTGAFTPPVVPLAITQSSGTNITAVTGTQTNLLSLQTNQPHNNSTYFDDSSYNTLVTAAGTPSQGTFSPYSPAGWSTYFSATANYLSATNSAFNISATTSVWTIECWVYPTSNITFFAIGAGTSFSNSIELNYGRVNANKFSFQQGNGTSNVVSIASTNTYTLNNWYHVAVTRTSAGVITLYVNGVVAGTQTYNAAVVSAGTTAIINGLYDSNGIGNNGGSGYVSNLRFVNGSTVYTGAFAPATSALTAVTNTVLLTCQDNRFKDNSTNALAITTAGTPKIQAYSPFRPSAIYDPAVHGGSTYFNGTTDILTNTGSTAFTFGSGDFTVEYWVYYITLASTWTAITGGSTTTAGWAFGTNTNKLAITTSAVNTASTGSTLVTNMWNHVAFVRTSGVLKAYLNGVLDFTFGNNITVTETGFTVGASTATTFMATGYISNLRVVKGVAMYAAAFTPPTAPVPRTSSTTLLLNSTAAAIIDASGKSNMSTIGDTKISTAVTKYGTGSVYFDGTGDYLSIPANTQNGDFGTGDFTVEFWMRASAAGTYVAVVGTQSIAGNTTAGIWRVTNRSASANGLYFNYTTGSAFTDLTFSTTNYNDGTWHHIAACRASGTLRMFVDGVSVGTPTTVSQSLSSGQKLYVGYNVQDAQYYTGYVDDLRITKGFARYTANFTPPIATILVS